MADVDPIIDRLEDQIGWFDRKSGENQRTYKRLKVIEIVAAAVIPFLTAIQVNMPEAPPPARPAVVSQAQAGQAQEGSASVAPAEGAQPKDGGATEPEKPSRLPLAIKLSVGLLGILITVIEGIIQLNQYNKNWISYRAANEALKREKYLFLAKAGPYTGLENARALLAERVETILADENAKWVSLQESTKVTVQQPAGQTQGSGTGPSGDDQKGEQKPAEDSQQTEGRAEEGQKAEQPSTPAETPAPTEQEAPDNSEKDRSAGGGSA